MRAALVVLCLLGAATISEEWNASQVFCELRDKYINKSAPPASTAETVAGLFREGFLAEVEAVAVVPE